MFNIKDASRYKHNFVYIVLIILSLIYICMYLRPSLIDFDENYTWELIHHSFSRIIYYDSMDVHPPLYYLLLKVFVDITTFWTSYLPLKILFARFFSIIIFIMSFCYLRKISFLLNISNNIIVQWILVLMLPNVLGWNFQLQQLTDIRMYTLATLFFIIEFYYLMKYDKSKKDYNLIIATTFSILAMYTHYYAALFSGILYLIYLLRYILKNSKKSLLKIFICGFVMIISYIPWMPVLLTQMSSKATYWITNGQELTNIEHFFLIILIFLYPFMKLFKSSHNSLIRDQLIILFLVTFLGIIFIIAYGLFKSPIFQYKYMFPILLIYEFLGLNIIVKFLKSHDSKLKYFGMIIIILLCCTTAFSMKKQISSNKFSINSVKIYNYWTHDKKSIYIHDYNYNYCINYVSYISNINNKFIVPNSCKREFKDNTHIYYNKAYRKLFKNDINKIYYINR